MHVVSVLNAADCESNDGDVNIVEVVAIVERELPRVTG